ncbi:uncharacterized protein ACRADG_001527 [Cochliomyia hominivorax]
MSDTSKPDHYNINAKICRLVEQYPCMYDRSHPHYLKKDVVDQAWIRISKEMNDSISSCKERWRNIRTSYARSINVNKIPASANRTKPYYLHEELQFLALHITPGIPVSRRSASNSYNGSNSFYTSPLSEKGDIPKVSLCDESIDSYAATMHDDTEDKTQFNQEERSNSVASDATSKNTQEMEQDGQQPETQRQQSPNNMLTGETEEPEFHPPVVQIEEDNGEILQIQNNRRDSVNYACAPPKKRLRVKDNCYASDNFPETKPLDLLPQHDYDGIFLQGLLPEMKAMDFRQKIIFKRRIYEVLGEIFDNSSQATSTTNNNATSSSSSVNTPVINPLQGVNTADLNMLRRLNTLLQDPSTLHHHNNTSTPARSASISSTVLSSPATPSTNSVPIAKIGATTRSSANMTTRGRLVNANVVIPSQNVKEEPEGN